MLKEEVAQTTKEMTYLEACREAIREEMQRDDRIFMIGEDIETGYGNLVSRGLAQEFGSERVTDTPISELAVVGTAVGAALTGMRPIAELLFADLMPLCMEQISNQAAKLRYMSGGQVKVPLVIRTQAGVWGAMGAHHSQTVHSWFVHIPGLIVVAPSTPYDVKGLMKASIRDDNPVIFFEHKMLYRTKGPVPEGEYLLPLGVADVKKQGSDITIVATSYMVQRALAAAHTLEEEGVSVAVVDPRTLLPLDKETILQEVRKTGKLVVVDEGCKTGGFASEVAAIVAEEAWGDLKAPIKRVCSLDVPMPFSPPMEQHVVPDEYRIIQAVRELVAL